MAYRILHSIDSANPAGGGVIEAIVQLSRAHLAQGHSVELVCMDPPDAPFLSQLPFPAHAMGPKRGGYGYSPTLIPWLRANLHRYDVVIINGLWLYNSFGTYLALLRAPRPYFVFSHGMLDPWFKRTYPLKHLKKWLYWPWSEYWILRRAQAVLFTCEEERRVSRESFWLYRCREQVTNFGITEPAGNPRAQLAAFRARFPELEGKRLLLFLGRVHVKKGPDLLFQAFKRLLDSLAPTEAAALRLVMAGPTDHAYGQEMIAYARSLGLRDDQVVWTGMLSGDLKWGAFRAAEVFVLPSHQENFGIAVVEALACGTPVLISDKVNIWREIQEDRAGLVANDDLPGTERLLRDWLALSPAQRDDYRRAAAACFQSRFRIERTASALIELFRSKGIPEAKA